MLTKVTLIVSLLLIVCIPWYVFWLAGATVRANPTVLITGAEKTVAIEVASNALLVDADTVVLTLEREKNASVVSVDPALVNYAAGGQLILQQVIHSDTVLLPILLQEVEGSLRVVQDVLYDVDYKSDALWIVAQLPTLHPIFVMDGQGLTFSYTNNEQRFKVEEKGVSAWALGTNDQSVDLSIGTVMLDGSAPIVFGATSTSATMHTGFSKEVEPAEYVLPNRTIRAGDSFTASSSFICNHHGEFDWFLRPALHFRYGVRIEVGENIITEGVTARLSARIFSKCEQEDK